METDNQKLLQNFLLAYIANLNDGKTQHNSNTNNAEITEISDNINMIFELYKSYEISIYKRPFAITNITDFLDYQVENLINYKIKLQNTPNDDKQLIYSQMHGGFNTETPQLVPYNVVLVFMTPLNRFGLCKSPQQFEELSKIFSDTTTRNNILNNIFCIDKHEIDSHEENKFEYDKIGFKNALVLYPEQIYFDIFLTYNQESNTENSFGTYLYNKDGKKDITRDCQDIENNKSIKYCDISLSALISNIINKNNGHTKINYIFLNACRELNFQNLIFEKAYVYENFMYYFNTIMSNCNATINSNLPNLPKINYQKVSNEQILYLRIFNKYIGDIIRIINICKKTTESKYILINDLPYRSDNDIKYNIEYNIFKNDKLYSNKHISSYLKLYIFLLLFIDHNIVYTLFMFRCVNQQTNKRNNKTSKKNYIKGCQMEAFDIINFNSESNISAPIKPFDYELYKKIYGKTKLFKLLNGFCDKYDSDEFYKKLTLSPEFLKSKTRNKNLGHRGRINLPKTLALTMKQKISETNDNANANNNIIKKTYKTYKLLMKKYKTVMLNTPSSSEI